MSDYSTIMDAMRAIEFVPSEQQANVFKWVVEGQGSAQVEAVAGAGKTTTLVVALMMMRGNVFFGAFNAKIAKEIKVKINQIAAKLGKADALLFQPIIDRLMKVRVSTMHGAGFSACTRYWSIDRDNKSYVNDQKMADIVAGMVQALRRGADPTGDDPAIELLMLEKFVLRMCSVGKQFLMGISRDVNNLTVWEKLAYHFSADELLPEDGSMEVRHALPYVIDAFELSRKCCATAIDYDDMIYAPLAYSMRLFPNDWVLMDEDQDANPARRELAKRMLRRGTGRFMGVGDRHQAIYGFTGAGADSIDRIIQEFGCTELPLTVTYRCPTKVVDYVHQWVQHIQAHPDAPEGTVGPVATDPQVKDPWYVQCRPEAADAILCRYTKPLIMTAYGMIKNGIACQVEGRDIGKGLIGLARRWKVRTLDALEARLAVYLKKEVAKAKDARSEKRERDANDRVETMQVFIDRCRAKGSNSVECVVEEITALFADDVTGVTVLSTGHKAKGREWHRVYWLQHTMRQNRQAWEDQQELNICYVIGTRAMRELILVPEAKQ